MKNLVLLVTAIGLLVLVGACKPQAGKPVPQKPGEVIFSPAAISITVGKDWLRIDGKKRQLVCSPTLVGKGGMIHGMLYGSGFKDLKSAAVQLRESFETNPMAVKDSFRQEEFTTDSGLQGIHLSYTTGNMFSHSYIIKNGAGNCAGISIITSGGSEGDAALEMIRKTLKLQ